MKKNKKNNKKNISPIFVISIIVIILTFGYSMAKYVIQESSPHIQASKEFYFNSNILSENNEEYILTDWNGKDDYTFTVDLKNFEDNLRCTTENIYYNISTSCDNNNITVTTSHNNNSNLYLTGGQNYEEKINITISPEINFNEGEFVKISIIANAIAPYEKTISATFKIYVKETLNYETNLVESTNSEYVDLHIETYDDEKNITISYDNTKLILYTNTELFEQSQLIQNGTTNSISVTLGKNSSYNIEFIKKDTNYEILLGTDIIITNN